jgi:transcriptional regulator with GAF, ATPase, and Fis domain
MNQLNTSSYMATIGEVAVTIRRETNREKALAAILPHALAISQAEMGALLVRSDETNLLEAIVQQGMPDEAMLQFTQGDLGALLLTGQSVWVKPQSSPLKAEGTVFGQHRLKYLFGLPLCLEGQVLGAIVVGSMANKKPPEEEQQRWLAILAQLVALFLDNIRLRMKNSQLDKIKENSLSTPSSQANPDEVAREELEQLLASMMSSEEEVISQNFDLGLLNTLSNEVGSTLQSQAILKIAITQTRHALGVEASWCYLFEDGRLTLHEHQGLSERYVTGMQHLAPGDGVEGMAFSRNEPVLRDGVLFHSGQARTLVQKEGLRTVAAVPLRANGETFGVLAVANHHDWVWSSRDRRMLTSISQQVAQALANSQRFTETQEKAQNWENSYQALQKTNTQLTKRTKALEQEIKELHQVEQLIWTALAASQKARHQSPSQTDEQLAETLKKILDTMDTKEYQLSE